MAGRTFCVMSAFHPIPVVPGHDGGRCELPFGYRPKADIRLWFEIVVQSVGIDRRYAVRGPAPPAGEKSSSSMGLERRANRLRPRWLAKVGIAAHPLASAAIAAPNGATEPVVTQAVSYAALDLNSTTDQQRLKNRISFAAYRLCLVELPASPSPAAAQWSLERGK